MAAGLGFKDFTTGEVLTAADVDGYLMQGVWVFASAAARDAAVTSPQEGNFAYLKDTNVTTYYTGSAWANLDTTGMTNPMTTTGDIIYSSPGSTPVRLGIGSTGNVLTVAGGVPSWAAPAGGGKVLQVVNATTATEAAVSSSTYIDSTLTATITPTSATSQILIIFEQICSKVNDIEGRIKLLRGGTDILALTASNTLYTNSALVLRNVGIGGSYLDSPATTSATTYKTQINSSGATFTAQIGGSARSSITLLEIGA